MLIPTKKKETNGQNRKVPLYSMANKLVNQHKNKPNIHNQKIKPNPQTLNQNQNQKQKSSTPYKSNKIN